MLPFSDLKMSTTTSYHLQRKNFFFLPIFTENHIAMMKWLKKKIVLKIVQVYLILKKAAGSQSCFTLLMSLGDTGMRGSSMDKLFPGMGKFNGSSFSFSSMPYCFFFFLCCRWELVGSISHCRAGAGVAVCSCLVNQIRDIGLGSSNVVDCMWFLPSTRNWVEFTEDRFFSSIKLLFHVAGNRREKKKAREKLCTL